MWIIGEKNNPISCWGEIAKSQTCHQQSKARLKARLGQADDASVISPSHSQHDMGFS